MAYRIEYTKRAKKDLRKLSREDAKRITNVVAALAEDPHPEDSRSLTHEAGYSRVRAGDYRAKYAVNDAEQLIEIARIGPRGQIYTRKFRVKK